MMCLRLNFDMSLEEFKRIYFMEWLHRLLGRAVGVAFAGPLLYFYATVRCFLHTHTHTPPNNPLPTLILPCCSPSQL